MVSPLNRSTAPQAIKLFDYCFKQGVLDACELEDDYYARDFLEARLADGGYGLLGEPVEEWNWHHWQNILYRYCRLGRIGKISETYIDRVHRYRNTFVFAILPICMRFYLMGIQEWLDYPNPCNKEIFKQDKRVHWKPVPSYLRRITTADFISLVQDFVYERKHLGLENDLSPRHYDSFAMAMWRCVQKYPVYDEPKSAGEGAEENLQD